MIQDRQSACPGSFRVPDYICTKASKRAQYSIINDQFDHK